MDAAAAPAADQALQCMVQASEDQSQELAVVLVSDALDDAEALSDAVVEDAEVVLYDQERDDLSDICDMLEGLAHPRERRSASWRSFHMETRGNSLSGKMRSGPPRLSGRIPQFGALSEVSLRKTRA